jgi:hypothetical protein
MKVIKAEKQKGMNLENGSHTKPVKWRSVQIYEVERAS